MEKNILSKSTYIKAMQCQKQLYLYKKRYYLRDKMPPERVAVFKRGHKVGHLAQDLFPNGVDLTPKSPSQYKKTVLKTSEIIQQDDTQAIYEAGFQADKTLILLDILVRAEDGWEAYEVKSSRSLSDTYYKDAALQNYIIRKSGLELKRFYLIHMNKDYQRSGELDLDQLFVKVDVTEQVNAQMDAVANNIQASLASTTLSSSPQIAVGQHCFAPYDCDFIGHCWKKERKPGFFNLPEMSLEEKHKLHTDFKGDLANAIASEALPELYRKQVEAWLQQKPVADTNKIKERLSQKDDVLIVKPLYFKSALPLFEGDQPYQKHLFAYGTLRLIQTESGKLRRRMDIQVADADEASIRKFETAYARLIEEQKPLFYDDNKGSGLIEIFHEGWYVHPHVQNSYQMHDIVKIWKPTWKAQWDCPSDTVAASKFLEIMDNDEVEFEHVQLIENYLNEEMQLLTELYQHLIAL